MKNLFNLSAFVLALTLTACGGDKPSDTPKTEAKTETTTTTTTTQPAADTTKADPAIPADIDKMTIKSPYMDFVVNSNRAIVVADIASEFKLSPEQTACLQSLEGNATYLEALEPFIKGVLSESEIKEADEFFATDAGRKFGEMTLKQAGVTNLPPFVEPTASEKAEIAKAILMPFFVKMKAKNDAMSEQEAMDFMIPMVKKEMERCKVS